MRTYTQQNKSDVNWDCLELAARDTVFRTSILGEGVGI